MSIVTAIETQAKRIAALEKQHAEDLWKANKTWAIACAVAFVTGFILAKLL